MTFNGGFLDRCTKRARDVKSGTSGKNSPARKSRRRVTDDVNARAEKRCSLIPRSHPACVQKRDIFARAFFSRKRAIYISIATRAVGVARGYDLRRSVCTKCANVTRDRIVVVVRRRPVEISRRSFSPPPFSPILASSAASFVAKSTTNRPRRRRRPNTFLPVPAEEKRRRVMSAIKHYNVSAGES